MCEERQNHKIIVVDFDYYQIYRTWHYLHTYVITRKCTYMYMYMYMDVEERTEAQKNWLPEQVLTSLEVAPIQFLWQAVG